MTMIKTKLKKSPNTEPSDNGVKTIKIIAPRYIGCRTKEYSPVEISFCPSSTTMIAEVKLFSLNTLYIR